MFENYLGLCQLDLSLGQHSGQLFSLAGVCMWCDLAPPLPHTLSTPFWIFTAYLSVLLANLGVTEQKGDLEDKCSSFLPTSAFF